MPASAPAPPAFSTDWLGHHPSPDLGVKSESGIVVDLDSKRVVWAREPHSGRPPASLAKLMTAIVAADLAGLDQEVTVPAGAVQVEPNVMGLSAGEVVTVRTLLYGLLLDSGNDAAETLARTLATREGFVGLMNRKAASLGLADSRFSNPSGLDDPELRSSSYDLAVLAATIADRYPQLAEIAGSRERLIPGTQAHKAYEPYNLNKLLWTYRGATGLKTGVTDGAGGCVAVLATRDGHHLAAVAMHSEVFFTDAARLLDYGFSIR